MSTLKENNSLEDFIDDHDQKDMCDYDMSIEYDAKNPYLINIRDHANSLNHTFDELTGATTTENMFIKPNTSLQQDPELISDVNPDFTINVNSHDHLQGSLLNVESTVDEDNGDPYHYLRR